MPSQYSPFYKLSRGYYESVELFPDALCDVFEEEERSWREEARTWTRYFFKTIFPEAFPRTLVSRVDKETVREKVDVLHLLATLGVTHRVVGGNALFCCIVHDDKRPSATFSLKKKVWYCFACATGGDIFTFVGQLEGLNFPASVDYLNRL
jgi:hypothetical protein